MADSSRAGVLLVGDPGSSGEEEVAAALAALVQAGQGGAGAATRLLEPLVAEAERQWGAGEWTPGREQWASGVVEVVRALLVARGHAPPLRARVPVVVAPHDWNLLPARLAALFVRLRGWDAGVLPGLPLHRLERSLAEDGAARGVVVCCSVPAGLPGAARRVAAVHAAGLPVLAVGPGFGPDGAWAGRLGADGWAAPAAAGEALDDLPSAPPFAAGVVPHREVAELRLHRAQLVDAALAQLLLRGSFGAGLGSDPLRHRRCLAGLARTLEAALLVADDAVLVDHVRWSVATARPGDDRPGLLAAGVAALAAVVRSPQAARLLRQAEVATAVALSQRHRRVAPAAGTDGDPPPPAPVGAGEARRVAALRRLGVLDAVPEAGFEDLTRLAATVCRAPTAGLAFVDADRVWFGATVGDLPAQEARATSPAAWAVAQPDPLVVPDAAADARFATHATVAAPPHLRFWAGAPVVVGEGQALGALFVAAPEPRSLGAEEYDGLRSLARQVARLLELRARTLDVDPTSVPPPEGGEERARLVRQLLGDGGRPDRLLRTREVALLFDVSERTVNYWASQGRLPSRQTAGGHRRYASRDVLQLFQSSSQLLLER